MGTLWVTAVALVIALPVSLFTAIYLSEYAPKVFREFAKPVIDLLAGIASAVFGVWGIMVIVPFVGNVLAPIFGVYSSGYSILAGGIVLAIMIFPTIIHVSLEVFASIPVALRETSLSLGATRWETVRTSSSEGRPGDPGGHPRPLPGVRRDDGRAHGRRQRPPGPQVFVPARIPPAGPHRQQLRGDDVHPPL
jgi:ABC-type phosphate transport system permease subunit